MMAGDAWHWLRHNQPESYRQLIERLKQASEGLSHSGQVELRQLAEVFKWCEQRGFELAEIRTRDHLHKYREAAARLTQIRHSDDPDQMRDAIARIRGHPSRRATRAWARTCRGAKAKGCQFSLDDGEAGLVVVGPGATIHRILSEIIRFVDWDLSVDDALLDDLQRAGRADA